MITEIAIVAGVAGVGLAIADQQNLFGINPERKWFWERPPFVPAIPPPAARIRIQPMVVPQRLNPRQELARAEQQVHYATQAVNAVKREHPELTSCKYVVTAGR
jgi:hypothetical protein